MGIYAQLNERLGPTVVTDATDIGEAYAGDWLLKTSRDRWPAALVRPADTAGVATTVALCHAAGVPLVVQGGRTGLTGGATPDAGWVVLSTERLRTIESVDPAGATLSAGAGATLQSVQDAADAGGMLFPLDIGSRGSCTVGGNISTNAGGNRVLRFGMMRELVLGIEAVLPDGSVVSSMNTMLKNNAGYDLKQLFIGSEGTLGVVTRAVLRLFPKPRSVHTAICALAGYDAAVALLKEMKSSLGATLSAYEMMWPDFYRMATEAAGHRAPLAQGSGGYVLIEAMGVDEARDAENFSQAMERALESGLVSDAVVAQSNKEAGALWAIRDSSGEIPAAFGPYVGFDVSLPVAHIGEFVERCRHEVEARWRDARTLFFGHIADSNIHICVQTAARPLPEAAIDEAVYGVVRDFAGSISAEHGIGVLKRPYLGYSRSAAELALMKRLKAMLDPRGILNPGKVFQ